MSSTVVSAGTRITVFWSQDNEWYKGTVAQVGESKDLVQVVYDDGESHWTDLSTTKYRKSSSPETYLKIETGSLQLKREKISRLRVGTRISVWWPHEQQFYTGTLTKMRHNKTKEGDDGEDEDEKNASGRVEPHHIIYDDGDEEWTNLLHRKFKRVHAKAQRLHVGSRVSVYCAEEKRHFLGTVTKIKLERCAAPHRVDYDDPQLCKREWLNLNVTPYIDAQPRSSASPDGKVSALSLKKRKADFLDPQPLDLSSSKPKKLPKTEREEPQEKTAAQAKAGAAACAETCGLCQNPAKLPRAASCHHIFCKKCIKGHFEAGNTKCPICKIPISVGLVRFDADHVSFKAVEALNPTTAEIVHTFSSASAASSEGFVPSHIINACQSKRRDDRAHKNFFWRFQGSKDRILRAGESIKEGVAIAQVSLETGEVIEVFASSRKASEKTGVSRCSIRRVLDRRGKASSGGFFWRFQGETHGPWPDPEPTNLNPVERLDYETGDFLESYVSLAEAKRAMGLRFNSGCIRDVCDGKGRATAQGFFWRWKGSKAQPNHLMGVQKIVQIRKSKNGKVVKEFRTSREAQAYFGYEFCWSTVCRYCREKSYQDGYYWQYRMLQEQKSAEEEVVGKRLRVKQEQERSDVWLEGQIIAFHADKGQHEIAFDSGVVEYHCLKDIEYEWKNDQGQKPVEQLDLKTGQVLASFSSISDAAAAVGSKLPSGIVAVCQGRSRSCKGFFWRYVGSDAVPPKPKAARKVEQLCLKSGRVLDTFDTIQQAAKAVGITSPGISYCCNGRNGSKSAGGFGWRFTKVD